MINRSVAVSVLVWLVVWLSLSSAAARAQSEGDILRLLRLTRTGDKFEAMARRQTRDILRTYAMIISDGRRLRLPAELSGAIMECYTSTYAWENFQPGIVRLLQQQLSAEQVSLLLDFHSDLGLPPRDIDVFKDTIAKAGEIQRLSIDYIFANSASCVERDSRLIMEHLARHSTGTELPDSTERRIGR